MQRYEKKPILQCILLQSLHKCVDALHLIGDIDALWALGRALVAANAMAGLAQGWDVAVVTDEETLAGFLVQYSHFVV